MSQLFQLRTRFLPALILLAGLLPSAWLLFELRDLPQLGLIGDDVMYVGAAHSLAHDGTYREYALPGDPWQTKYPPGYPLLLAAILKWDPPHLNFWIIAHSWVWLAVASAALAWAMLQAGLTAVQAALVGALWAANPSGAEVGILAMADAPYCALLFFVLGLIPRLDKAAVWKVALAGLLMGIACLIRSAGIVALVGLIAWMLWRKSFKTAFWFGAFASFLPAIWILWSHAHLPADNGPVADYYFTYLGRWRETMRQAGLGPMLVTNVRFGLRSLAGWLIPFEGGSALRTLGQIFLAVFGCVALAEWRSGAITSAALAAAAFQLFWNWPPNGRLFLPIAPAFLGAGVAMLFARPAVLRVVGLVVAVGADIYGVNNLAWTYGTWRDSRLAPAYSFIRTELPPGAVVLGDDRVWLFTSRKGVGMPMPMEYFYSDNPDSKMAFFMSYKNVARQFGAQYMLLGPPDGLRWNLPADQARELADAIHSDRDLERIFSQNGVELFRIRGSTEASLVK